MNSKIRVTFADGKQEDVLVSYEEWKELFVSGYWCGKRVASVEVISSDRHSVSTIKFS